MYIGSYVVNLPYLPQPVNSYRCSSLGWDVGRRPPENLLNPPIGRVRSVCERTLPLSTYPKIKETFLTPYQKETSLAVTQPCDTFSRSFTPAGVLHSQRVLKRSNHKTETGLAFCTGRRS